MPGFAADDPVYLTRPEHLDGLFNALMEVASEVWVMRDRCTVLEHLLAERGSVTAADLDEFQPDGDLAARLAADRRAFLGRIVEAAASGGPR
ncbi:hypothetical protein [Actinocorallia sp. A-T 12471]|uniref:hypothetical protein n=1 Tax=Actinocorallia sp. A-T 12471 TaxID=3089813 RepID=UPI0029D3EC56|nr:hypothetical protein [Actinocorallia sp. A-T 12471]MDX6744077.1 hypothetical protein [Actinocorallia sp. A-T 12471]